MNKNKKMLFLAVALVTVLILVSAVNATNTTDKSIDNAISEKTSSTTSSEIKETTTKNAKFVKDTSKEKSFTNNVKENKEIKKDNKTEKQTKTTTKTVEVNNYNGIVTAIKNAFNDNSYDEFIINLENGNYELDSTTTLYGNDGTMKNIIINGNNQRLDTYSSAILAFKNTNITFNNLTINHRITNQMNSNITFNNTKVNDRTSNYGVIIFNKSTINCQLTLRSTSMLIIDEETILGKSFYIEPFDGEVLTNNTQVLNYLIENGYITSNIIENQIIDTTTTITGDMTIRNSTINAQIINRGNLTIEDDVIFGENCNFVGEGTYTISDINKIANYLQQYYGEYTFNNVTIENNQYRSNYATLTFTNSTLNSTMNNYGTLIISDDTVFGENFVIKGDGDVIINDTSRVFPYQEAITTDMTLENMNIAYNKINYANTSFINCNISRLITNQGNITFINCSFSNNNMNKSSLYPSTGYLLDNKGTARLENCVIENNTFNYTSRYNYDKINGAIVNNGTMTVVDLVARNNSLGFYYVEDTLNHGYAVGKGSVLANYGILTVESSNFTDNYAGESGGAIYNEAKLIITNSIFENNLANSYGGAIRSSFVPMSGVQYALLPELNIENTLFKENKAIIPLNILDITGGGAISIKTTNSSITNCTFTDNQASTAITGLMGVIASGSAISIEGTIAARDSTTVNITKSVFSNHTSEPIYNGKWGSDILSGNINNCTFEENNMAIYDVGNLNITNNIFKNNYGDSLITNYIRYNGAQKNIENNQFIDNKLDNNTINTYISADYNGNTEINIKTTANTYINTTIDDNIDLSVPNKIYTGEPITITGTYTLNTPENYDADILEQTKFNVYINGELDQTIDTLEFTVTPTAGKMIITVQPTISQTRKSTSIRPTTLTNIIITPENYNEYIHEGALIGVSKDSKIIFQGMFQDKGNIAIDTPDIILDGTDAQFTNTVFKLESTGITIQNMDINNSQTDYPIINTADNNIITQNTITLTNANGKTAAIYNKASNTEITYNTLYVDGPAIDIDHSEGYGIANTQAILLIGGDKNKVEYNTVKVTTTGTSTQFGTTEAITNHKEATNTIISNNNITLTGNANFKYGINSLNNIENITITNNNIQVTGERYTDGIQIGTGANNILIKNNNIKCVCQNTTPVDQEAITYGITTVTVGGIISNNITIQDNNIDLTGTANYGIELYTTNNTLVENNTINVNGPQSMGIGLAHSPNSTIIGNNIKTNGDSTIPLGTVTEEIRPANAGIQVQQDSNNILIQNNTIQTYDKAGKDNCINITTNNVTVKDNNLTSSTKTGDNTITTKNITTTTIEDNTAIEQNSTTQTTTEDLTIGDSTTITAQFYDDTYTPVSSGKAIFRVNGKTLRDNQGNVIFADVINGRAELPDVNITQEWTKEGTTIQAVYMGDENTDSIITEKTPITVTKPEATITLDTPKEATAGQEITLKATVTDGDTPINSGRVAFKLNGKTLKDPKTGKALYANVQNGEATITYTIPEKTKAKEYVLTAVFTDSKYDRKDANSTLTVVKA